MSLKLVFFQGNFLLETLMTNSYSSFCFRFNHSPFIFLLHVNVVNTNESEIEELNNQACQHTSIQTSQTRDITGSNTTFKRILFRPSITNNAKRFYQMKTTKVECDKLKTKKGVTSPQNLHFVWKTYF